MGKETGCTGVSKLVVIHSFPTILLSIFIFGGWGCTGYYSSDQDANNNEYFDAYDGHDSEVSDGDINIQDDGRCESLSLRFARCVNYPLEGGWVDCPIDTPPEVCKEDCPFVGKPQCLQWWIDNICKDYEGEMSSLNADYGQEQIVLGIVQWSKGTAGIEVSGEVCNGDAILTIDTCHTSVGQMSSGLLFAVVVPANLEPVLDIGTVLCGPDCEAGSCENDVSVIFESGCAPYSICP